MAYILLALAACFWGGNYVVGHILVANSNPMILSERRWAITALLLHLLYHKQVINDLSKIKKSFKTTLFLSLLVRLGFIPYHTLYRFTLYDLFKCCYLYVCNAGMVLAINKLIFNDHISKNNFFGVLLSILGVIYLVFKGDFTNIETLNNLNQGDLWAMSSAISWAIS